MKISRFMKAELLVLSCTLVFAAFYGPEKGLLHITKDIVRQAIKMPTDTEARHELLANTFHGSNAMAGLGKLRRQ